MVVWSFCFRIRVRVWMLLRFRVQVQVWMWWWVRVLVWVRFRLVMKSRLLAFVWWVQYWGPVRFWVLTRFLGPDPILDQKDVPAPIQSSEGSDLGSSLVPVQGLDPVPVPVGHVSLLPSAAPGPVPGVQDGQVVVSDPASPVEQPGVLGTGLLGVPVTGASSVQGLGPASGPGFVHLFGSVDVSSVNVAPACAVGRVEGAQAGDGGGRSRRSQHAAGISRTVLHNWAGGR